MGEAISAPLYTAATRPAAAEDYPAIVNQVDELPTELASASWQDIKHNFKHSFRTMRESLRIIRHDAKAIGHLAMLDVEGAQAELEAIRSFQPVEVRQTLMERIRSKAAEADEEERREKWQRKQKRHRLRNKSLGVVAVAGLAFSVGASVPLLENLFLK
jgi:hypothetical protein